MTGGRNLPARERRSWEAWLGDSKTPASPPRLAQQLDALLRAGPEPQVRNGALARLSKRLRQAQPGPVYYDRIERTPVGALWVAVSDKGLVAVEFETPEREFRRRVERRLRAPAVRAERPTVKARRQMLEYLQGRRQSFELPVDLRDLTPFQQSVLRAALAVPRGHVSTYGQIARRIGRPGAARAVGQALGNNPVPIVVPCHRVLGSDGSLHGYSGGRGIKTKAWLLQLEGAQLTPA
ncbi:MAG TPA: methylated-DNA--[protein]-cysteine S-methyltransferase [Anaerolineales bacterium]|nr:methylated-DNA--[protein]-cysteine S-methyltransferase [Anaerolineales bacterium]